MRRDLELAYKLLEFVEENGSRIFKGAVSIEGYERDMVVDHLYLLADGGYITLGQETLADRGQLVMTWKGCDYLDEIRAKQEKPNAKQPAPTKQPAAKPVGQKPIATKSQAPKPAAQTAGQPPKKPVAAKPAAAKPAAAKPAAAPLPQKPAPRPQPTA